MKGIKRWTNPVNKFRVLRIHYTADPDKASEEWYAKTRPGYTATAWDQEFEITFASYEGKGVFSNEFIGKSVESGGHVLLNAPLDRTRPIFRIWDFGYHHPAVLFVQEREDGHHYAFDELMGTDILLQKFVPQVIEKTNEYNDQYIFARDFCDPAGKSPKSTGESDIAVLYNFGIKPRYKQFAIKDTVQYVQGALSTRLSDGWPILLVDEERCPTLFDALAGGYRYPPVEDGKAEKPLPLEDGYYEHLSDTLRYYCGHRLRIIPRSDHATRPNAGASFITPGENPNHDGSDRADTSERYGASPRRPGRSRSRIRIPDPTSANPLQRSQIVVRETFAGPEYTPLRRDW